MVAHVHTPRGQQYSGAADHRVLRKKNGARSVRGGRNAISTGNGIGFKRNHGAVLLAKFGESQVDLAKKAGLAREQIAYFQSGQRRPGPLNRARLKKAFGIPEKAWDEEPAASAPASSDPIDDTIDGRITRLQRTIDQIQEDVLADTSTTRREKLGELKEAIAATALLAKLSGESQEISYVRLIRLPVMRVAIDQLLKALEPWPEAMLAAGEALKRGTE
jgi:transcriptional regulator with XRE-family HTH domain